MSISENPNVPDPVPVMYDFHADLPEMNFSSKQMAEQAARSQEDYKVVPGQVESVVRANLGLPSTTMVSEVFTVALRLAVDKFAADLNEQSEATAKTERDFWQNDDELGRTVDRIKQAGPQQPGSAVA